MAVISANGATRASAARPAPTGNRLLRPTWLQATLLLVGAILLPAGLLVIGVGWYGASHTPYAWEQTSYLISGGLFGLGLAFVGGFLYFGSWLAKISADNRDAMFRLSESLQSMADALARAQVTVPVMMPSTQPAPVPVHSDPDRTLVLTSVPVGTQLVATANGTMAHRADCGLVAGRTDLRAVTLEGSGLKPCRLCLG